MFGVWFVANFIANFTAAGITGSFIDPIVEDYGMAVFFLIFTILPAFVGFLMILANKKIVSYDAWNRIINYLDLIIELAILFDVLSMESIE